MYSFSSSFNSIPPLVISVTFTLSASAITQRQSKVWTKRTLCLNLVVFHQAFHFTLGCSPWSILQHTQSPLVRAVAFNSFVLHTTHLQFLPFSQLFCTKQPYLLKKINTTKTTTATMWYTSTGYQFFFESNICSSPVSIHLGKVTKHNLIFVIFFFFHLSQASSDPKLQLYQGSFIKQSQAVLATVNHLLLPW